MTRSIHRDSSDKRPIARELHPLEVGNYRIDTPAIEAIYDLVKSCMDYKITGALICGPSRIGKTRAIEYLRLAMAQNFAKVTTHHVQAEHKPKHAEGTFFTSLLEAVGCPEPDKGSNPSKRLKLIDRIKDACARNGSGVVAMFFDEAQRYGENEYEWLRDVHDHLDRINIRLFTFLIGQEELHAVKTAFQQARKTQIVARLMVEELRFHGLRDPADTATCLDSYDTTCFPRGTDWSFTRFFIPNAVRSGYRLAHDAQLLWNAFEEVHNKNGLPGDLEIPMESFARAVEIMLKGCWDADAKARASRPRPLGGRSQGLWLRAGAAGGAQGDGGGGGAVPRDRVGRQRRWWTLAVLPILTFDEARLSPSRGYIFNRRWLCPHETILDIAWKLARINALPGHILVKQLALRPIDPYEGIPPTDSHVAVSLLARTFAIPRKALVDGLHKAEGGQQMHDRRRFCAACMALASHGVMHQRVGSSRCPWHGVALEEHCRGCGATAPYRLNARLLGSPFRCAECRRPDAGWRARLTPQPAPA